MPEQEVVLTVAPDVHLGLLRTLSCGDPPACLLRVPLLYGTESRADIRAAAVERQYVVWLGGGALWTIVSPVNGPVPTQISFSSEARLIFKLF